MAENNKDRLKEITDSIEQSIKDLFQSDRYAQYLRTMSRFHRYSANSIMLIYMQKPNATLVTDFNKWRDLFPSSAYPNASTVKKPTEYDIPPEAMADTRFAAMMTEAQKYIGYPYVWGVSSPKTSFDCSGYVSWVIGMWDGWGRRASATSALRFLLPTPNRATLFSLNWCDKIFLIKTHEHNLNFKLFKRKSKL
jgi:cell wall-associated NlpC family hydrolase